MAQSHASNPQLSLPQLVSEILDVNSKEVSLLSLCLQTNPRDLHDGQVVSISSPIAPAVSVAEGAALAQESDLTIARASLDEHKSGNSVVLTTEILDDSMAAFRENVSLGISHSHKVYSDNAIADMVKASTEIVSSSVASLSVLSLGDIHTAAATLRWFGRLPNLYCSNLVYNFLKESELASGVLSDAGLVCGLPWVPSDLGSSDQSGDLLAMVGHLENQVVAADRGLRVNMDDESSVANALTDQFKCYSYHRFGIGEYGSGLDLASIKVA